MKTKKVLSGLGTAALPKNNSKKGLATNICWRVLLIFIYLRNVDDLNQVKHYNAKFHPAVKEAEQVFTFLLLLFWKVPEERLKADMIYLETHKFRFIRWFFWCFMGFQNMQKAVLFFPVPHAYFCTLWSRLRYLKISFKDYKFIQGILGVPEIVIYTWKS